MTNSIAESRSRMALPALDARAAVMQAALKVFERRGFAAASVQDVLQEAGISVGAFRQHFIWKEDILDAIARDAARRTGTLAMLTPDGVMARLNVLLERSGLGSTHIVPELRPVARAMLRHGNDQLFHQIAAATAEAIAPAMIMLIRDGVQEGVFETPSPELATELLLSLAQTRRTVFRQALEATEADDPDLGVELLSERLRSEAMIIERLLAIAPGRIELPTAHALRRTLWDLATG